MKKKAERLGPLHIKCPFCDNPCDRSAALAYCSGCYVEYYKDEDGEVIFDTKRKTSKFAIAKALNKAGGLTFGNIKEDDQ